MKKTKKKSNFFQQLKGTTRDVSVRQTEFNGQEFSIVDTGGMMSSKQPEHMASEVSRIAEKAADEADIIVFMADYKSGPTQDDKKIALKIRNSKKVNRLCISFFKKTN